MTQSWDLVVIGGGSGGLACAQRAARHGARVAIAEPGHLGGTCVNAGCVPKKLMYHAADIAHALVDAADYGFTLGPVRHDWSALKARRDAYVERLRGIYLENLERSGATLIRGRARLAGVGRVTIGGETHAAKHVVVATGGQPSVPALPGADAGITSDGFFALERLPGSVAIVGSGYVAAELSGVFAALGARVTVVIRHDRLLRSFDEMLSARLMAAMQADGIQVAPHAAPESVESSADGHRIRIAGGSTLGPFECVLWATGREPLTSGLGLAEAGVKLGQGGEVLTDLRQDTNVAGIHAIGDVTGRSELTPVAIAAGRRLADRLFGGEPDRHLD
jgi:glutathione reductase (NADPH)